MTNYEKKVEDIEIFLLALRKTVNEGLAMIAAVKQSQSGAVPARPPKKSKQVRLREDVTDIRMRIATGGRKPRK